MKADVSRRDFLKTAAATGAAAGLATIPGAGIAGAAASRATTKLVVYGPDTLSGVPGYKSVFAQFEKAHNASIQYVSTGTSDKFVTVFTAAQQAGDQIDVVVLNGQDTRRYALAGDLLPLDGKIDTSRFVPSTLDPFKIHGHLWSLPGYTASELVLAANKYWFDKVGVPIPRTFDDMVTAANKLKQYNVSLLTHEGGNKYLWPIYFFMAYDQTTGNKSNQYTLETLSGKRKFTDPEVVQALTILENMAKNQFFTPDTLTIDFPGAGAEFLHGKAAMYFQWGGMIGPVNTKPYPKNMNLVVTHPMRWVNATSVKPRLPGGSFPAPSVWAKGKNPDLALKLVDFLTTDASAKTLAVSSQNVITSNRNVHISGTLPPAQVAQLQAQLPLMFTYMDWTWPPEVTGAFQTGIQGIIAGQQTPQQVAQTAQQTLDGLRAKGYTFQA